MPLQTGRIGGGQDENFSFRFTSFENPDYGLLFKIASRVFGFGL
jgi:hypothetical protein